MYGLVQELTKDKGSTIGLAGAAILNISGLHVIIIALWFKFREFDPKIQIY